MDRQEIAEATSLRWIQKHSALVFLVLTAVGSLRIISTYRVFSQTYDEPAHIASGMLWLSEGRDRYGVEHPPLARVAAAAGLYLSGQRSHPNLGMWEEGQALLGDGETYTRNLALARLGILPFFWIGAFVVYVWGKRCLGEPGAALAVFLFTFLPPVLAHSGLATTDMAVTAMVGASFLSALIWFEEPTLRNSLIVGAVTGLAVLSKFSALPFLAVSFAFAFIWYIASEAPTLLEWMQGAKQRIPRLGITAAAAFIVIWAGYRFSYGSVSFSSIQLPAPDLYAAIERVIAHNSKGDPAFLFGQHSFSGWWYYYLIVLAVKTPLPFLILLIYGLATALRNPTGRSSRFALAFSASILWFSMSGHINLGVRHILPVYIGFTVIAAAGAVQLLRSASRLAGWILVILLLWMASTSALSHPDYLPYFNAFAGRHPENILVDSDLDWGQDMKRLADRLHALGAQQISFTPSVPVDLAALGFPTVQPNDRNRPSPGWNAVSLTVLKKARLGLWGEYPDVKLWPESVPPTEKIGKGIWLWYFPP